MRMIDRSGEWEFVGDWEFLYSKIKLAANSTVEMGIPLSLLGMTDGGAVNISLSGLYDLSVSYIDNVPSWDNYLTILLNNTSIEGWPVNPYLRADLDADDQVSILDIAFVARAYGSKLGDPNWNRVVDFNHDTIINILDVTMIAVDFGKKGPGYRFRP